MFEQKHSDLLVTFSRVHGLPDQDAEHARKWTMALAEQFAYSFPTEGWGTKRADAQRPPSTDVICRPEPPVALMGYDVVISAGSPDAKLNLNPQGEDISNQVFIAVEPINHIPATHNTMLQASLFWAWRGMLERYEQLEYNVNLVIYDLGGDSIRWFFTVGDTGKVGEDPWSGNYAEFNHPRHYTVCSNLMMFLQKKRIKSHMVLCGGLKPDGTAGSQFDTQEKRDAIVDRAAVLINNYPNDYLCVEMINEWKVNGAVRSWLRDMARRLKSQVPAHIPITLSSPDTVMGGNSSAEVVKEEIEGMYGGDSGANCFTMHSTRPNHLPWNPETIRQLGINMDVIDGEPRGPGASGGDFTDPNITPVDYQTAIRGKAKVYDFHTMPGVWGGCCDARWSDQNEWANLDDVPHWEEIAASLKSIRQTGNAPEIPGGGGGEEVIPYDEEKSVEFGLACNDVYMESGAIKDPGMVSVHSSRAAWDYYSGKLSWEDSFKLHINDFRREYGLPPL